MKLCLVGLLYQGTVLLVLLSDFVSVASCVDIDDDTDIEFERMFEKSSTNQ